MGQTLKICEYNVENLFISLEYCPNVDPATLDESGWRECALSQSRRRQKPLRKLWGLARAILDINADVLMLVEVGGADSLQHFNRLFLEDRYEVHFLESNSTRGIDLGFLVRKNLSLRAEALSNREIPVEVNAYIGAYRTRFSRDVAELRLHGAKGPALILLLTHLKSKISSDQDFRGNDVRAAEGRALAAFYEQRRRDFPDTPIVLAGDFNTNLEGEELAPLRATDLRDFHDLIGTPAAERATYPYFDPGGALNLQTLDYILLSPSLQNRVIKEASGTYRYRGYYDLPDPLPTTLPERWRLPSDHYPLYVSFTL